MNQRKQKRRRGQALIETFLAMIGLLVLLVAIGQIGRTGHENISNYYNARGLADDRAENTGAPASGDYVHDWDVGDDGLRYTADDEHAGAWGDTVIPFTNNLYLDGNDSTGLSDLMTGWGMSDYDQVSPLLSTDSLVRAADLRRGRATENVPVDVTLERLLLPGANHLHLEDEVYMPGINLE
jgi:hypothetical protein